MDDKNKNDEVLGEEATEETLEEGSVEEGSVKEALGEGEEDAFEAEGSAEE